MDHHDSRMRQSSQGVTSLECSQKNLRKSWMLAMGLLVTLAQPMWALASPPDHAKAVFMRGEVTMIHIDEVVPEQSRFAYFIRAENATDPEDVLELIFEGNPPANMRTGKKVSVRGKAARRKIWVTEVAAIDGDGSGSTSGEAVAAATTGDRKTITFVINMSGVNYADQGASPYTQASVDLSGKYMHDSSSYSVHSTYEEASFGQVTFSGSASTDVFLVDVPYDSTESCAYRTISSQADAASPVSLNGYVHKMYVVPPAAISGCSWLALGEVGSYGSTSTRKSWSTRIDPLAFAHELGHNLGYHHAATDPDNDGTRNVEYGDTSDLMGYCCAKRKLNSVHVDQIGWFDRADLQDKIVDVTGAGQFSLAPLGTDPVASSDPQILRITPLNGWPYYLSYRQRTGKDSAMSSSYTTGVNIHRGMESGIWSHFIKVLKSDFSDPNFYRFHDGNNGITITQVENNANYVTIDVSFDSCVVQAPNVSVSPSSQMVGESSQIQPYTVTVVNNDTLGCDDANLSVAGTFPSGVTGTFQDSALTLAPGTSGSTMMNVQLTSAVDANYPLMVTVSGSDPRHQGQASTALIVDATAPTAPTGVSASVSGRKRNQAVQLSWNAASDGSQGSGVANYHVYRNGSLLGSSTSLSYSDRNFSTTSANDYQVYAEDQVGHVSATSGDVTYLHSGGDSSGPGGGNGGGKGKKK